MNDGLIFLAPEQVSTQALHQAILRGVDVQMTCPPVEVEALEEGRYRAVGIVMVDEVGVHAFRREGTVEDLLLLCMGSTLVASGQAGDPMVITVGGLSAPMWVVLVPQTGDLKWAEELMRE